MIEVFMNGRDICLWPIPYMRKPLLFLQHLDQLVAGVAQPLGQQLDDLTISLAPTPGCWRISGLILTRIGAIVLAGVRTIMTQSALVRANTGKENQGARFDFRRTMPHVSSTPSARY